MGPILPPPPPQTWLFPGDEPPPTRQFTRLIGRAARAVPRAAGAIAFRALVAFLIMVLVAVPLLIAIWYLMLEAAGT